MMNYLIILVAYFIEKRSFDNIFSYADARGKLIIKLTLTRVSYLISSVLLTTTAYLMSSYFP